MLVEIELPNDELVGKEILFKVAVQSSENYFMISSTHGDALPIEDPRAQEFYKEMFNSMAMQNEERQYFGITGKIDK